MSGLRGCLPEGSRLACLVACRDSSATSLSPWQLVAATSQQVTTIVLGFCQPGGLSSLFLSQKPAMQNQTKGADYFDTDSM